jgi:hypothetical protein
MLGGPEKAGVAQQRLMGTDGMDSPKERRLKSVGIFLIARSTEF